MSVLINQFFFGAAGGGGGGGGSSVYFTDGVSGETSTSSTTLSNLFSTTVLASQQQASQTYLGFWSAEFQSNTNSVYASLQLTKNGTAVFPVNALLRTNYTTEYGAAGGLFIHSAGGTPADATYAIQYAPSSAATMKGRNSRLSWIKMGANDVYATALASQTSAITTQSDAASITFTPPTTGDYLILCSFTVGNSASTQSALVQVTDGTTSSPELTLYGSPSTHHIGMIPLVLSSASGSKTVALKYRSSSTGNTVTISNVVLVALRLDRFAANYKTIMGSASTGTETTYTAAASQTFTPTAAPHLTIAAWNVSGAAASSTNRTQVKYTDDVTDVGVSDMALVSSTAGRAIVAMTHQISTYAASSRTQTLYRASNSAASVSIGAGSGIITLSLSGLT